MTADAPATSNEHMAEPHILMISGGIDSVTLAHFAKSEGYHVKTAVFLHYGHEAGDRELHCARRTCIKLDIPFEPVDITGLKFLFFGVIPTHFHPMMAESKCPDQVVPFGLVATYAILRGVTRMMVGTIADDQKAHPRLLEFIKSFSLAMSSLHQSNFEIVTPFIDMSKSDVLQLGAELGVDYTESWGCYAGGIAHCGMCHGCQKRLAAFADAGAADPAAYFKGLSVSGSKGGLATVLG